MHPFITQSIATERARDRQQAVQQHRDAALARDRRSRQRRAPQVPGTARLLPARLRPHMP
jgi:hypothetical protein